MAEREFIRATMEKISLLKEYREKYGEEDIIAIHMERMQVSKGI